MLRLLFAEETPVFGWERLVLLRHLLEQGLKKTDIAARCGVSRRLVYHWIKSGLLDQDVTDLASRRERQRRPDKLERYKATILQQLETYPELSAVRLFEEVRTAGYRGGITQLRDFVHQVRPRPPAEDLVRFETPPGLQAQVDFAECRFPWGKRYGLLVVLGYSRLLWVQFFPRHDAGADARPRSRLRVFRRRRARAPV